MPKRAERRHHEERVKSKFKKVARRMAGVEGQWVLVWKPVLENGKKIYRHRLDQSRATDRLRFIEKTTWKMAHHPRHQCQICRLGEHELRHKHNREIAKKAPLIVDEE